MKGQQKTRRSAEEWRRIVKRSDCADKTQLGFCEAEGVALSTLPVWRRRLCRHRIPALP